MNPVGLGPFGGFQAAFGRQSASWETKTVAPTAIASRATTSTSSKSASRASPKDDRSSSAGGATPKSSEGDASPSSTFGFFTRSRHQPAISDASSVIQLSASPSEKPKRKGSRFKPSRKGHTYTLFPAATAAARNQLTPPPSEPPSCAGSLSRSSSVTSLRISANHIGELILPPSGATLQRKAGHVAIELAYQPVCHYELPPSPVSPLSPLSSSFSTAPSTSVATPTTPISPNYSFPPFIKMSRLDPGTTRAASMDPVQPSMGHAAHASTTLSPGSVPNGHHSLPTRQQDAPNDSSARQTRSSAPSNASQTLQTAGLSSSATSAANLSGLVCNVHRTTGREPHSLVGATTTIVGDKLYVFGGRRLSRSRPQLVSDLYELDLVRRDWTKVETRGDVPPPRYFHSVCALGDTKLVCYGGMCPIASAPGQMSPQANESQEGQPEFVVMTDIHIYDIPTRTWQKINTVNSPQGRYAHCACVLPSSGVFTSPNAPLSAIHNNPSSGDPNQGSLGVEIDGTGGAEMIVVGGQDSANHYIEQISVFNFRSFKWTTTTPLGRSCGAYRSVTAPLLGMQADNVGEGIEGDVRTDPLRASAETTPQSACPMLIYSNYNFLDVKLELQVRRPDGSLIEKPLQGNFTPPGLRFPNGGIINGHFVVSGTFLTSSKQEYALWALNLRNLTWNRIDAGGSIFSQGSWNRGVLWNRRNTFVVLGNRKRSLVEDYNHRRINFANVCYVELEAFGLYDNPRVAAPRSDYLSASAPSQMDKVDNDAGGRPFMDAATELGQKMLGFRELADMDFLTFGGERIPVNSHLIARRWGPYFNELLSEGSMSNGSNDASTLRPNLLGAGHPARNSSLTITPSITNTVSSGATLTASNPRASVATERTLTLSSAATGDTKISEDSATTAVNGLTPAPTAFQPATARSLAPTMRPRTLYLPHSAETIQLWLHYLYTSSLPAVGHPLCSPQTLCSILQLARPYRVDGLVEATIERLHQCLDGRNTAAIFNAAAMAAGGGEGVAFASRTSLALSPSTTSTTVSLDQRRRRQQSHSAVNGIAENDPVRSLRIDTALASSDRTRGTEPLSAASASATEDDDISSQGTGTSLSELSSAGGLRSGHHEVWEGGVSAVVGLQKRGLRGLMEGRRMRERGRSDVAGAAPGAEGSTPASAGPNADGAAVGLGLLNG